jgi:hypothetical protein
VRKLQEDTSTEELINSENGTEITTTEIETEEQRTRTTEKETGTTAGTKRDNQQEEREQSDKGSVMLSSCTQT